MVNRMFIYKKKTRVPRSNFWKSSIFFCCFLSATLIIFSVCQPIISGNFYKIYDYDFLRGLCILGFVIYICSVLSWYTLTKTLFCPYLIFYTSFYLFQAGQSLLYIFDIKPDYAPWFYSLPVDELIKAQIFNVLSLLMFHIGAIITCICMNSKNKVISSKKILFFCSSKKLLYKLGMFLFMLVCIPSFTVVIINAINSIRFGYVEMRSLSDTFNNNSMLLRIFSSISIFLFPSIFMVIIGNENNDKKNKIFIFIALIYSLLILLGGSRTNAVATGITIIWFYNFYVKKFTKKQKIGIFILMLLSIFILPIWATFRAASDKSFEIFLEILSNSEQYGFMTSFIGELGYSIYPLILMMNHVPTLRPFALGASYLASVSLIIPKTFLFGLDFSHHINLAGWLSFDVLNQKSGVGLSMNAEAYYNFGWWGIFVLLVYGFIISLIFYYTKYNKDKIKSNPFRMFFLVNFLYFNITLPRAQFASGLRNTVYCAIICFIIYLIVIKRINKNLK